MMSNLTKTLTMAKALTLLGLSIVILCLFLIEAHASDWHRFDQVRFDRLYRESDVMFRQLHGCPPEGYPPEAVCVEGRGRFDVRQWERVADFGKELFK